MMGAVFPVNATRVTRDERAGGFASLLRCAHILLRNES